MTILDVPEWALSYLINRDYGDLSEDEIKMIDDWVRDNNINVLSCDDVDGYFSKYPEFGLPCICHDIYVEYLDNN